MIHMKGIELCKNFYDQVVRSIVTPVHPTHGACLIGHGSEVLGFDTEMSHDHDWYARCFIFVDGNDTAEIEKAIQSALDKYLPSKYEGFDTQVIVCPTNIFFKAELGFDPYHMTETNWLSAPSQILRELTTGAVFKESDELLYLRNKLKFYPRDILLYILAAQWKKISQEMAFMGRSGDLGDNIGSAMVCSRLFGYIMRLCFLYEGQYAPYWKWFGTAFNQLSSSGRLKETIEAGLLADGWREKEKYLSNAYTIAGEIHNESSLTLPIKPRIETYYGRPFLVPNAEEYESALYNAIKDENVKALTKHLGNIDQISDHTNFIGRNETRLSITNAWFL